MSTVIQNEDYTKGYNDGYNDAIKELKQMLSGLDSDLTKKVKIEKQVETIEVRKLNFRNELATHRDKTDVITLKNFFEYWTEKKPKGRKMRFEKEPTFDMGRRLGTWLSRQKNGFNRNATQTGKSNYATKQELRQQEIANRGRNLLNQEQSIRGSNSPQILPY